MKQKTKTILEDLATFGLLVVSLYFLLWGLMPALQQMLE